MNGLEISRKEVSFHLLLTKHLLLGTILDAFSPSSLGSGGLFLREVCMVEESREETPEVLEVEESTVERVEGESISLKNTMAQIVEGGEVHATNSAAGTVNADSVTCTQSALGSVTSNSLILNDSAALVARTEQAQISQSKLAVMAANAAVSDDLEVGLLASRKVDANQIKTGILLARNVEGPVEAGIDTQEAVIYGVLTVFVAGLILTASLLLFGGKRKES